MSNSTLVFISLGSNINPEKNTHDAIVTLTSKLNDCRVSAIYNSPAVGMEGADFYNAVIGGYTPEVEPAVLQWLRDIEDNHGRVRTDNKFIDRPLDLDLLLFGTQVSATLPHRDIIEQAYVLQPLSDIAPALIHPKLGLTIEALKHQQMRQSPDKFNALTPVTITDPE